MVSPFGVRGAPSRSVLPAKCQTFNSSLIVLSNFKIHLFVGDYSDRLLFDEAVYCVLYSVPSCDPLEWVDSHFEIADNPPAMAMTPASNTHPEAMIFSAVTQPKMADIVDAIVVTPNKIIPAP